jgi:formamidopyrimidine-DNA glycosylase
MPELPEVETTRRGLLPAVSGRAIQTVHVRERRLRWTLPADFEERLTGRRVRTIERRGKYLLFVTDQGTLIVHLGMSGSLRLVAAGAEHSRHDHVDIVLDSGRAVRFDDPRRFGSMHFTADNPLVHPLLAALAPEPLSQAFDGRYLHQRARRKRVAVKQFMMDSHAVVGVGNIYASEALYRARIRPGRAAGRLTLAECARLAAAIKRVLARAIQVGGTTLRDYVNADGEPGYFRQKLYVYERAGRPCRRCRTPIRQSRQGARSTYWCPNCQR